MGCHLINRYPVAIKYPKISSARDTEDFLEEAKSMIEIDAYHENIVNLQGITWINDSIENYAMTEVVYHILEIIYYPLTFNTSKYIYTFFILSSRCH